MPARRRNRRVPANLRIVMSVRVDKTGRDDEPVGVDDFRRTVADFADFGDLATGNCDVGLPPRRPCAVDHGAILINRSYMACSPAGDATVMPRWRRCRMRRTQGATRLPVPAAARR